MAAEQVEIRLDVVPDPKRATFFRIAVNGNLEENAISKKLFASEAAAERYIRRAKRNVRLGRTS